MYVCISYSVTTYCMYRAKNGTLGSHTSRVVLETGCDGATHTLKLGGFLCSITNYDADVKLLTNFAIFIVH